LDENETALSVLDRASYCLGERAATPACLFLGGG